MALYVSLMWSLLLPARAFLGTVIIDRSSMLPHQLILWMLDFLTTLFYLFFCAELALTLHTYISSVMCVYLKGNIYIYV